MWQTSCLMVKHTPGSPVTLFDESLPAAQDWDYLYRLLNFHQMDFAQDILVRIGADQGNGRISTPQNKLSARLRILEKYEAELQIRPATRSYHHVRAALAYFRVGNMPGVTQHCGRALGTHPRDATLYLLFMATLLGRLPFHLALKISRALSRRNGQSY